MKVQASNTQEYKTQWDTLQETVESLMKTRTTEGCRFVYNTGLMNRFCDLVAKVMYIRGTDLLTITRNLYHGNAYVQVCFSNMDSFHDMVSIWIEENQEVRKEREEVVVSAAKNVQYEESVKRLAQSYLNLMKGGVRRLNAVVTSHSDKYLFTKSLIKVLEDNPHISIRELAGAVFYNETSESIKDYHKDDKALARKFSKWVEHYKEGKLTPPSEELSCTGLSVSSEITAQDMDSLDFSDLAVWLKNNHRNVLKQYLKAKAEAQVNKLVDEVIKGL